MDKGKLNSQNKSQKKILSIGSNTSDNRYQLDTAADFHVSGIENDFDSYCFPQTIRVAGGGRITATGKGNLLLPSIDGKLETLNGAIHLPGEKTAFFPLFS